MKTENSLPVIRIYLPRMPFPCTAATRLGGLMNSSAVRFGSNPKWTDLVKLQANNKMYAFPLFGLGLYPIGPAKSTLTASNGADPSVGNPAGLRG